MSLLTRQLPLFKRDSMFKDKQGRNWNKRNSCIKREQSTKGIPWKVISSNISIFQDNWIFHSLSTRTLIKFHLSKLASLLLLSFIYPPFFLSVAITHWKKQKVINFYSYTPAYVWYKNEIQAWNYQGRIFLASCLIPVLPILRIICLRVLDITDA